MEELVDIFDEVSGNKTGEVISKEEAHKRGIWHSAIHILIFNKNNDKILLQKRCPLKKLYPNMWDISVGGHISTGEEPLGAAQRELSEELGLYPQDYKFVYVDRIKEEFFNNGLDSKEFVYIYRINEDIDLNKINLQEEEVSECKWFNKEEFNELVDNKLIINHLYEYELIRNILKDI